MRSPGRTETVSTVALAGERRRASRRLASSSATWALGLGEAAFAGGDVLCPVAGVGELVGGEGLLVALAGGLDVFGAGAGFEDGEVLLRGLG